MKSSLEGVLIETGQGRLPDPHLHPHATSPMYLAATGVSVIRPPATCLVLCSHNQVQKQMWVRLQMRVNECREATGTGMGGWMCWCQSFLTWDQGSNVNVFIVLLLVSSVKWTCAICNDRWAFSPILCVLLDPFFFIPTDIPSNQNGLLCLFLDGPFDVVS